MLDTKLKNNHKTGWIVTLIILLCCSVGMLIGYNAFAIERNKIENEQQANAEILQEFVYPLISGNYILYNEVTRGVERSQIQENYNDNDFYLLRKYMDYEVFDWDGNALLGYTDAAVQKRLVQSDCEYYLRVKFVFSESGQMEDVQVDGEEVNEWSQYELEQSLLYSENVTEWNQLSTPNQVVIIYGITEESMNSYCYDFSRYMENQYIDTFAGSAVYLEFLLIFGFIVTLAALLLPRNKTWEMGSQKIFRAPLEVVLCAACLLLGCYFLCAQAVWYTLDGTFHTSLRLLGMETRIADVLVVVLNGLMWFAGFAGWFWCVLCLRAVFTMKWGYFKERCLTVRGIIYLKNLWKQAKQNEKGEKVGLAKRLIASAKLLWKRGKNYCRNVYDELLHLDFQETANKTILKVVVLNFVFLAVCSAFWFFGVFALALYSLALFLLLRRYLDAIKEQYATLLTATSQLAQGNLNVSLEEDYGVFNPMGEELDRIRDGFKLAVEKEVKSERMKTELITNVSHDLKTPLTAIITYVDLLKSESDEEKRKEYINILEQKSLRLKVLIEDLFEISKAASRNVTMNFVDVDIVNLLKQVGFEYDEAIKNADLEVKWKLPAEKVILSLDSQKTYRIFENLIVNITKYAMPHTRVYVEMECKTDSVCITLKNISATELNFDDEEITSRFVRGDSSRNTEGSGLGLAIAKNFTELQHGKLKVVTDGDLFKAEIVFPTKKPTLEMQM